jgi:hypothetical protein
MCAVAVFGKSEEEFSFIASMDDMPDVPGIKCRFALVIGSPKNSFLPPENLI